MHTERNNIICGYVNAILSNCPCYRRSKKMQSKDRLYRFVGTYLSEAVTSAAKWLAAGRLVENVSIMDRN